MSLVELISLRRREKMNKEFEEIKFPNMKVEYRSTKNGEYRRKEFAAELKKIAKSIERYGMTDGKTEHCRFEINEQGA